MPLDPRLRALEWVQRRLPETPLDRLTPARARVEFDRTIALGSPLLFGRRRAMASVRPLTVSIGGKTPRSLRARLYRPVIHREPQPVVVFFHGGGWVLGSIDTHDKMARSLAFHSGLPVLAVDYRLAPEVPFPGPLEDAYATLEWIAARAVDFGLDGGRLAVAGDSAGGNLAASTCLLARDRGGPAIRTQVLFYPGLDTRTATASYEEFAEGQWLTAARARWFRDHYATGVDDLAQPYLSPARATDVRRLPEALVLTAERDVLRDEGESYAAMLRAAGVPTELFRFDGMVHGFSMMEGLLPEARRSLALAGRHLARTLRAPA